ncbi:MAG: hypothetical protein ACYS6W_10990 [Planctomycetota bacterium]
MINNIPVKNKGFLLKCLALHRFILIFLLDEDPAGGEAGRYGAPILRTQNGGAQIITPALDVFREGEELFVIRILPGRTVFAVLFFYILSHVLPTITIFLLTDQTG